MTRAGWLIDKSALVRLASATERQEWAARIERGLVHISTITLLEVGYSARSSAELHRERTHAPISNMPLEYSTPTIENRALEVQSTLATHGHHRAPSIPDLLVAATAEMTGLSVLHVDKDFDLISEITGQPVETLACQAGRAGPL